MKKITLSILLLLSCFVCKSQDSSSYPRYFIDNNQDTLGIIYSIDQAQRIYNNELLVELFKDFKFDCDSLLKRYLIVVSKYEQKQIIDRNLIEQYEKKIKDQDNNFLICQKKNQNYEEDLKKCNEQISLKDNQFTNDKEIIKILKKQRNWLMGGTIGFGVLAVFLSGGILLN